MKLDFSDTHFLSDTLRNVITVGRIIIIIKNIYIVQERERKSLGNCKCILRINSIQTELLQTPEKDINLQVKN